MSSVKRQREDERGDGEKKGKHDTGVGSNFKIMVVKSSGQAEPLNFQKIYDRLEKTANGNVWLHKKHRPSDASSSKREVRETTIHLDPIPVDVTALSKTVIGGVFNGVTTKQLDELAAETCAYKSLEEPIYSVMAARILMSRLHKEIPKTFSEAMGMLYEEGVLLPTVHKFVQANAATLNSFIKYKHDYEYNYFGIKTMFKGSYFKRVRGSFVECPQYALLREAVALYCPEDVPSGLHDHRSQKDVPLGLDDPRSNQDLPFELEEDSDSRNNSDSKNNSDLQNTKQILKNISTVYFYTSNLYFTHATPTKTNAGLKIGGLSSCFLVGMKDDSISGIYDTLKTCALISKAAGGIGLHIHNIRAKGSAIKGTMGNSNGIIPMLRNFNSTAVYVDQGGGHRPGAISIYLEPWHADIRDFLNLKDPSLAEDFRCLDLFLGLWIPDLFMERVENDENWTLFCPSNAPGLADCHGQEFNARYTLYESNPSIPKTTVKARDIWQLICKSMSEHSAPYILFKDACNAKSNQKHLGTIKSSNLCTEIIQYSSPEEVAVCNLASIALPKFVEQTSPSDPPQFNYSKLYKVVDIVTRNLNRVIDVTSYPVPEAKHSNLKHRPIGIGVQGLADVFIKMKFPFESEQARDINRQIFETIYHSALNTSCDLAKEDGPHESFEGSPASQGLLQFDLWKEEERSKLTRNWTALKAKIAKHKLRNSLLVAPMPTASTSQILGNTEGIDPITSNIYIRKVLSGNFPVINKYLIDDLVRENLWTPEIREQLFQNRGSIQNIPAIPQHIKDLYKTCWEISQKALITLSADRGIFVDQSQSLNLFLASPQYDTISSMLFFSWKKGLKTGCYYLKQRPPSNPFQFTVSQSTANQITQSDSMAKQLTESASIENFSSPKPTPLPNLICTRAMREAGCESCSA